MIRPSNIDIENHTADFKCDKHGGSVSSLNLNTNTSYNSNSSLIIIQGDELSPTCNCVTLFPVNDGNQDAQLISSAKTN